MNFLRLQQRKQASVTCLGDACCQLEPPRSNRDFGVSDVEASQQLHIRAAVAVYNVGLVEVLSNMPQRTRAGLVKFGIVRIREGRPFTRRHKDA